MQIKCEKNAWKMRMRNACRMHAECICKVIPKSAEGKTPIVTGNTAKIHCGAECGIFSKQSVQVGLEFRAVDIEFKIRITLHMHSASAFFIHSACIPHPHFACILSAFCLHSTGRKSVFFVFQALETKNFRFQGSYFFPNFRELKKQRISFFCKLQKAKKQGFYFFANFES